MHHGISSLVIFHGIRRHMKECFCCQCLAFPQLFASVILGGKGNADCKAKPIGDPHHCGQQTGTTLLLLIKNRPWSPVYLDSGLMLYDLGSYLMSLDFSFTVVISKGKVVRGLSKWVCVCVCTYMYIYISYMIYMFYLNIWIYIYLLMIIYISI